MTGNAQCELDEYALCVSCQKHVLVVNDGDDGGCCDDVDDDDDDRDCCYDDGGDDVRFSVIHVARAHAYDDSTCRHGFDSRGRDDPFGKRRVFKTTPSTSKQISKARKLRRKMMICYHVWSKSETVQENNHAI